jgi:hypothetical protein
LSDAKKEARAARVSGGHAGISESTYVCNVLGGMVVTSAWRASGVGGSVGFEVSGLGIEEPIEVRVTFNAGPSALNAASEGDGVRSCLGSESTTIASDSD